MIIAGNQVSHGMSASQSLGLHDPLNNGGPPVLAGDDAAEEGDQSSAHHHLLDLLVQDILHKFVERLEHFPVE